MIDRARVLSQRSPQYGNDVDVLFREFSPEERQAFLALGERVSFETDEVVLTAGSSEWDMYIIEEGELSIWIGNACLAQMPAGQTLGTSAFLLPQIQWYAVRGDVRGTLLRIPREAAMDYFAARHARLYQQFCVNLFKSWVGKLKQRNERIVEIQQQILVAVPATGRFKLLLVDDEAEILAAMEEFFADRYDT